MLTLAVEGVHDEAVLRKLCKEVGVPIAAVYGRKGKRNLDANLAGYNYAAHYAPWLVLRDLDFDAECAPRLVDAILPDRAPQMYLRITVRSVESWLLADRESIAEYLGVSAAVVPRDPESLDHPKRVLVDLARRSRRRAIRDGIVPAEGAGAVGPGYTSHLVEFVTRHWNPLLSAENSTSLDRCIRVLQRLGE